jgi:putative membrane protein insertion efficiency factor
MMTRPTEPGVVARLLLAFIRAYQSARAGRPSPCRFWPSCSTYAAEAIERHGARRGTWLAVRRLGRCHPFGGAGVDPVPEGGGSTA